MAEPGANKKEGSPYAYAGLVCTLPFINVLANFTSRYALVGYSHLAYLVDTEDEVNYMMCRLLDSHTEQIAYAVVRLVGARTSDKAVGTILSGVEPFITIPDREAQAVVGSMASLLRKRDTVNATEQFNIPVCCLAHVLTEKWLLTGYVMFGTEIPGGRAMELIMCRLYNSGDKQSRAALLVATYEGLGPGEKRKGELSFARNPVPTLQGTAYCSFKKGDCTEICKALRQTICRDQGSAMGMCENPEIPPPAYLVNYSRPSGGDRKDGQAAPDVGVGRADNVHVEDGAGTGH